jgi:threonine dehydrogenase-like Zn-dependent dehydrogenase
MVAAVLQEPRRAELLRAPVPEAGPGETLVRIEGCGVCSSNLPLWEGRAWFEYPLEPGAPGHEGWGIDLATGGRVALLSGCAFAEYEAVPEESVVPLPDGVEGPFPGEALGCAMNVFARSGVRAGDRVAVVGVGFLGALLVQLCVRAGARVHAFTRRSSALAVARSFGAETPAEAEAESYDVAIEAAGVQPTLDCAGRLCKVRGRLVIAGYHQDGARQLDLQSWNWRGLDVVNAHERDRAVYVRGVEAAAAAVADGRLDPTPLYTHVYPLYGLGEAFEAALTRPPSFMKALVLAP